MFLRATTIGQLQRVRCMSSLHLAIPVPFFAIFSTYNMLLKPRTLSLCGISSFCGSQANSKTMSILLVFQFGLVLIAIFLVSMTLTNSRITSGLPFTRAPLSRQQKAEVNGDVSRDKRKNAFQDLWNARMSLRASKQRAKLLVAVSKKEGASRSDKRAAMQAISSVRNDIRLLKHVFTSARSLREGSALKSSRPKVAAAAGLPPKASMAISMKMPKRGTRRTVIINGRRLPVTCHCARQRPGESRCYFFTRGRYCSARYCAPSYACVTKRKSKGTLCLLRRVATRIVPIRENRCRKKRINSYMYVPYERY